MSSSLNKKIVPQEICCFLNLLNSVKCCHYQKILQPIVTGPNQYLNSRHRTTHRYIIIQQDRLAKDKIEHCIENENIGLVSYEHDYTSAITIN